MDLEAEVAAVERRWQEAVRDRDIATLDALLACEFTLTTGRPGAPVRTRADYLRLTASEYVVADFAFEALDVVAVGDHGAVVR